MRAHAVFLVGFMASGKTSVGQELARRLRWDFIDLDRMIESREGKSVPAIFADHGESHFRRAETAALRELTSSFQRNAVVALGGGAFPAEQNRELLRGWPSIFLAAPPAELWRRCRADPAQRPLRKDEVQFARLYEERLPFYKMAQVTVETMGRDVSAICDEIEGTLKATSFGAPSRSAKF